MSTEIERSITDESEPDGPTLVERVVTLEAQVARLEQQVAALTAGGAEKE